MKLNKKQTQIRNNISKLKIAVTEIIGKICKESNYEITYAEINAALTDAMRSNLGFELKEMWSDD